MFKVIEFAGHRADLSAKNGTAILTTSEARLLSMVSDSIACDGITVTQFCRRKPGSDRGPTGLIGLNYTISEAQLRDVVCAALEHVYDVTPTVLAR